MKDILVVSDSDPAEAHGEAERLALTVRLDATASLVCACGARARVIEQELSGVTHAVMEHENNCPAVSPVANRAMRRAQRKKGRTR